MRLYLDESVSIALAVILTQYGIDCLTARDAELLGATDEDQLRYAADANRAIFTHDTRDFLQLAQDWQHVGRMHAGIMLSHQMPLSEVSRRFRTLLLRYRPTAVNNLVLW